MKRKELSTKWWYRLLQVIYGVTCVCVLGTLALIAFDERPKMQTDYNNSKIICEKSGANVKLSEGIGSYLYDRENHKLYSHSHKNAKEFCFQSSGFEDYGGEYLLEISDKLNKSWSDFIWSWALSFLIAILILFGIRQATLYILSGRS